MTAPSTGTAVALPLGTARLVSYQHHSYPLAILDGLGWSCGRNWLFSHYVQIRSTPVLRGLEGGTEVDFWLMPNHFHCFAGVLFVLNLRASLLWKRGDDLAEAASRCLAAGYFLQASLDDYHIPGKRAYGKFHFVHESLIHAIDLDQGTACILGFDAQHDFRLQTVPLDALARASHLPDLGEGYYAPEGLKLLAPRIDRTPVEPDPRSLLLHLDDYIQCRDPSPRFPGLAHPRPEMVHGIGVHDVVAEYYAAAPDRPEEIDIRPAHLLWEHKSLMHERLARLEEMGLVREVADRYAPAVQSAQTARLLAMKLVFKRDPLLAGRLAQAVREAGDLDRALLPDVFEQLGASLDRRAREEGRRT